MNDERLNIAETVAGDGFRTLRSGRIKAADGGERIYASVDPRRLTLEVESRARVRIALVHTQPRECFVEMSIGEGAEVEIADIFLGPCFEGVNIRQAADSRCTVAVAELSGANVAYRAELNGRGAEWRFDAAFVGTDNDRCSVSLDTRHNTADCRSESMVKGVVSGRASGEFRGLVYVAPDAQRTDARQQSRNIELGGEARISAQPQLEIYADDVKCSHGATVGHRDEEALFYMRQRGLSEKDAERLQIEGFVKDVLARCSSESLRGALERSIDSKLEKL